MALTDECINRLYNWKFGQAANELTIDATPEERELVEALAIFGDPGWFLRGEMEVILRAALSTIVPDDEIEEGDE